MLETNWLGMREPRLTRFGSSIQGDCFRFEMLEALALTKTYTQRYIGASQAGSSEAFGFQDFSAFSFTARGVKIR
jgi:hypothetical protein